MKIILATNNQGKVKELKATLKQDVYSLQDLDIDIDIIESGETLAENARIKAEAISKLFPSDIVIADDTGLFVKALNNQPGVYSARYAGSDATSEDNIDKLLNEMHDEIDRSAYFETVVVVYKDNQFYAFSGKVFGKILTERRGTLGFGYDSIFYVEELNKSLAEVTNEEKNLNSHRGKAIENLIESKILGDLWKID